MFGDLQKDIFKCLIRIGRFLILQGTQVYLAAVMDDGDAVAEFFRYFQHMGGKQHGVSGIGVFTHHLFELVRERGSRPVSGSSRIQTGGLWISAPITMIF